MENYTDYEITIAYKRKVKYDERIILLRSIDAVRCIKSLIGDSVDYQEMFYALYLDNANKLIAVHKIGEGTVRNALVDAKFIFQGAILSNATQLVIAHNHPSGSVIPSRADIQLTEKIKTACELIEVNLIDSIIISNDNYYSFAEEGKL